MSLPSLVEIDTKGKHVRRPGSRPRGSLNTLVASAPCRARSSSPPSEPRSGSSAAASRSSRRPSSARTRSAAALERVGLEPTRDRLRDHGPGAPGAARARRPRARPRSARGFRSRRRRTRSTRSAPRRIRAVEIADQMIRAGDDEVVVAGGMESMSNAPYLLKQARFGYRLGDGVVDRLDGARRPHVDLRQQHMVAAGVVRLPRARDLARGPGRAGRSAPTSAP